MTETYGEFMQRAVATFREEGFTVDDLELDGGNSLPVVRLPATIEDATRAIKLRRDFGGLSAMLTAEGMVLYPSGLAK